MKKIINQLFFILLFSSNLFAEIQEASDFTVIEQELETTQETDLVLFDVDNTLIVANDALFRPCGEKLLNQLLLKLMMQEGLERSVYLASKFLMDMKTSLVDPNIPNTISNLQQRGVKCIALTAMKSGSQGVIDSMEDWRYQQLKEKDIDFSLSFPDIPFTIFDEFIGVNFPPTFKYGILASGTHPKGVVLTAFLKKFGLQPTKIIVVDDNLNALKSIESEVEKLGIPNTIYHYSAVKNLPCVLDNDLAQFQCDYLIKHEHWLSDEDAAVKIKE